MAASTRWGGTFRRRSRARLPSRPCRSSSFAAAPSTRSATLRGAVLKAAEAAIAPVQLQVVDVRHRLGKLAAQIVNVLHAERRVLRREALVGHQRHDDLPMRLARALRDGLAHARSELGGHRHLGLVPREPAVRVPQLRQLGKLRRVLGRLQHHALGIPLGVRPRVLVQQQVDHLAKGRAGPRALRHVGEQLEVTRGALLDEAGDAELRAHGVQERVSALVPEALEEAGVLDLQPLQHVLRGLTEGPCVVEALQLRRDLARCSGAPPAWAARRANACESDEAARARAERCSRSSRRPLRTGVPGPA